MKVKLENSSEKAVKLIVRFDPEDMKTLKRAAGDTPLAIFVRRAVANEMAEVGLVRTLRQLKLAR